MRTELDALLSLQRFFAEVLPFPPWDVRTDLEVGAAPVRPFALVEQNGQAQTSGAPPMQDVLIPYTVSLFPVKAATRKDATDKALDLREQVWQAVKWGTLRENGRPTTDRIPLYDYTPRTEHHRFSLPSAFAADTFTIKVAGATTTTLDASMTAADIAAAIGTAINANPGDVTGIDRGSRLWDVYYGGSLAGQRIGDPELLIEDNVTVAGDPVTSGAAPVVVGSPVVASVPTAQTLLQGMAAPWRGPSDYLRVDSFAQNTVPDEADPTLVMVAVDLRLTFTRSLPLPSDQKVLQRIFSSADPEG